MKDFVIELRKIPSFQNAIVPSVTLIKAENTVEINVITDTTYTQEDEKEAKKIAQSFIPAAFSFRLAITKLVPDEKMVARKIMQLLNENNKAFAALISEKDITVKKSESGFYYTIAVMCTTPHSEEVVKSLTTHLKKCFCGEFKGECVMNNGSLDDLEIEEDKENIEYIMPIRKFNIEGFEFLEGSGDPPKEAVYLADMNFESESVLVCGTIEDIAERSFTKTNGQERVYYNYTITDTTATMRITYFPRQKTIEKIKKLQVGDSVVFTGRSEIYKGAVRFTATTVDYGKIPFGFVPEKRISKPAPKYYSVIEPQPYTDFTQTDLFSKAEVPDCLKQNTFVVFDLETTGLSSSPSSGYMDRIIEIGAYKVIGGEIKESFSTFVNPEKKLSDKIIELTGIKQEMVENAPTYQQVMPDFFKFCQGSYLVGHNIANFDFKFVDHYCAQLGYILERKIFDTIPLSQELLFLSNYKLNTVADHFGITFNHHRAVDDALVTAKIFIELIKIKKSLPKAC